MINQKYYIYKLMVDSGDAQRGLQGQSRFIDIRIWGEIELLSGI